MAVYSLEENGWSTNVPNRGKFNRPWADILKHKETLNLWLFCWEMGKILDFGQIVGVRLNPIRRNSQMFSPHL